MEIISMYQVCKNYKEYEKINIDIYIYLKQYYYLSIMIYNKIFSSFITTFC